MSDSPILFIKDSWLVGASHLSQRITELSNLALPLIPEIHVTAADPPTARQAIGIRTSLALGVAPPIQVSHTIVAGDTLWKLAERYYRDGKKWSLVYAANRAKVGSNPDLLTPGRKLQVPKLSTGS